LLVGPRQAEALDLISFTAALEKAFIAVYNIGGA